MPRALAPAASPESQVPVGAALTGMIPASYPDHLRANLLYPAIMVPPLRWLASARSNRVTGRRLIATHWREDSPEAAAEAGW